MKKTILALAFTLVALIPARADKLVIKDSDTLGAACRAPQVRMARGSAVI